MSDAIIVALIGLAGSALGSIVGILVSSKLMQYRIEQLEAKVEKHNSVMERTFRIEEHQTLCGEKFKVINHRLEDLEKS